MNTGTDSGQWACKNQTKLWQKSGNIKVAKNLPIKITSEIKVIPLSDTHAVMHLLFDFRTNNKDRSWSNRLPKGFGKSVPDFRQQPLKKIPAECKTPYGFHKLFLDDAFIKQLVKTSQQYAARKDRPEAATKITSSSMRTAMAIMYMTGYITPSTRRMYWEQREDTRNLAVKKAMPRSVFDEIVRNTCFTDQLKLVADDRLRKVRPLFDQLNRTAKRYVGQSERVTVDKATIKQHVLRQYVKDKPRHCGYNLWMMASSDGELLACQPHDGPNNSSSHIQEYGLGGQGPNVVLALAEQYGLSPGSKVYCGKQLVSLDLVDHMGARGYGITGPLGQKRLVHVPLPSEKEVLDKFKKGKAQAVYTEESTIVVAWRDHNQPVYLASNFDRLEPVGQCRRYSASSEQGLSLPQPNIGLQYSQWFGRVELVKIHEMNYPITTSVKKWSWPIYTWFLNMCMVQAWRLYRAHMKAKQVSEEEGENTKKRKRREVTMAEEISLLEFTRQVVEVTFQKHAEANDLIIPQREASAMLTAGALADIRYDSGRHLIRRSVIKGVCKQCKKRSQYRCYRCNVALHADCFFKFHVQEEEGEDTKF